MSMYKLYRHVVDWVHGFPEDGLDFYYQQQLSYMYDKVTVVTRVPSLKWFLQQKVDDCSYGRSYALLIGSVYHKKILPVIDADSESSMVTACMWLEENKVKYATLSSSTNGFWIILDKPGKWKNIKRWLNVPGQDGEYVSFCLSHRMPYIRGVMKEDYHVPVLIGESGSELVDGFANKIIEHFSSKPVRWLHRLEAYKDGRIDFTNPEEVDVGFTFDEVIA